MALAILGNGQIENRSRCSCTLRCFTKYSVADLVENENLQFAYKRSKQTLQAVHVCTHIVRFANFSEADFCKSLLGSIPNPLTIFSKSATLLRS